MKVTRGLLFSLVALAVAARGQNSDSARPASPAAENAAQLIGILPELTELRKISTGGGPVDRWQLLWLHQRISEQVQAASLQVDASIAQIDNEISHANELRAYLADRRDRAVNRANLLGVVVGGGLGAAGSGMQLTSNLAKTGDALSLGGGILAAGIGMIGIHAQGGKTSRFDFQSNMLAEFFDRPMLSDSRYPEIVWTFLNEPSAYSVGVSRREQLVQTWIQVRRIDSLASKEKIDQLTSQPSELRKLSIDDFEDRAAMLQDVRARISFLKRDLGTLLASLPAAPPPLTGPRPTGAP
jgi:hypothetical protein